VGSYAIACPRIVWSGYDAASASTASLENEGGLVGMACTCTMSLGSAVSRYLPNHHDDHPASGLASGSGIGCSMRTSTRFYRPGLPP
jgi:hypothetical protein